MSLIPSRKRSRYNYEQPGPEHTIVPIGAGNSSVGFVSNGRRVAYSSDPRSRNPSGPEMKYLTKRVGAYEEPWNSTAVEATQCKWVIGTSDSGPNAGIFREGQWLLCQNMARTVQGTGDNQCIGNKYNVKHLQWRFLLTGTIAQANTAQFHARIVIFIDKNSSQNKLTPGEVLEGADGETPIPPISAVNQVPITAFTTISGKGRFKILHDKIHAVSFTGNASQTLTHLFEGFIKLDYQQQIQVVGANIHTLGDNLGMMINICNLDPITMGIDPVAMTDPKLSQNGGPNSEFALTGAIRVGFTDD